MWDNSLFLSPSGMAWIWETTLQKLDRLFLSKLLGISGYTFERVRRVVGLERGDSST